MRTWIIGTCTAVYRTKAGKVIAEEDRNLPGFKESDDSGAAELSDIFNSVQTKDVQLQLMLFWIIHVLPPIRGSNPDDANAFRAYVAIIGLFVLSRLGYTVVSALKFRGMVVTAVSLFSVLILVVLLFWNVIEKIRQTVPQ